MYLVLLWLTNGKHKALARHKHLTTTPKGNSQLKHPTMCENLPQSPYHHESSFILIVLLKLHSIYFVFFLSVPNSLVSKIHLYFYFGKVCKK